MLILTASRFFSPGPALAVKSVAEITGAASTIGVSNDTLNINRLIDEENRFNGLKTAWKVMLGVANVAVLLLMLVVGFGTLFKIQIDTYHIKKAIMPIIIGIILANFSLLISRMFLDFSNILTVNLVNSAGGLGNMGGNIKGIVMPGKITGRDRTTFSLSQLDTGISWDIAEVMILLYLGMLGFVSGAGGLMIVGGILIFILLQLVPTIFFFALGFLFYIRNWFLIFLIAASPLAFLFISFSPLQPLFKKWWDQFLKWTFMVPVSFFFIWVAVKIGEGSQLVTIKGDAGGIITGPGLGDYILGVTMLFLAITAPITMGGAVMKVWSGAGKKLVGMVGGWGWRKANASIEKAATFSAWGKRYNKSAFGRIFPFQSPRAWQKAYKEQIADIESTPEKTAVAFGRARIQKAFGEGVFDIARPLVSIKKLFSREGPLLSPFSRDQAKEKQFRRAMVQEAVSTRLPGLANQNVDVLEHEFEDALKSGNNVDAVVFLQALAEKEGVGFKKLKALKNKMYDKKISHLSEEDAMEIEEDVAERTFQQDRKNRYNKKPFAWVQSRRLGTIEGADGKNKQVVIEKTDNELASELWDKVNSEISRDPNRLKDELSPQNRDDLFELLRDHAIDPPNLQFLQSTSGGGGTPGDAPAGVPHPSHTGAWKDIGAGNYQTFSAQQIPSMLLAHRAAANASQTALTTFARDTTGVLNRLNIILRRQGREYKDATKLFAALRDNQTTISAEDLEQISDPTERAGAQQRIEDIQLHGSNLRQFRQVGRVADSIVSYESHRRTTAGLENLREVTRDLPIAEYHAKLGELPNLESKGQLIKFGTDYLHFSETNLLGNASQIRREMRLRAEALQERINQLARENPTINIPAFDYKFAEGNFKTNDQKKMWEKWRDQPDLFRRPGQ